MKALANLVRLHSLRLDEKRKHLAELELRREELARRQAELVNELSSEKEAAQASLDAGSTFVAYLGAYEERRDKLAAEHAEAVDRVLKASESLSESYRELKRYETALANRKERARKEAERRNRIEEDEIGVNMFRRKAKETA